jgi:hypothetical protein
MKAKGLMTAVLLSSSLLISSNAFADSVKITILVQGSASGLNATVVEHGPRGVPFDDIDLSTNNREHGWGWGTMLHANGRDHDGKPPSSLRLESGPASTGSGLTLAVSMASDNSAVLFVRDTRLGSTLGIFGPDGPPSEGAASPIAATVVTGIPADPAVSIVVSAAADAASDPDPDITEVPEPTSLLLLGAGLVSLAAGWRLRKRP